MDNEQETLDNTFVFSERWSQADTIRLEEKLAKYSARMGIDIGFILGGLESPDRINLLMKSERLIPPAPFFFLKTALAI